MHALCLASNPVGLLTCTRMNGIRQEQCSYGPKGHLAEHIFLDRSWMLDALQLTLPRVILVRTASLAIIWMDTVGQAEAVQFRRRGNNCAGVYGRVPSIHSWFLQHPQTMTALLARCDSP